MVSTTISLVDTKTPTAASAANHAGGSLGRATMVGGESSAGAVGGGGNGSGGLLSEQISMLFPKCRPRNDVNLNPVTHAPSSPPSSSLSSSNSSSVRIPLAKSSSVATNPFLTATHESAGQAVQPDRFSHYYVPDYGANYTSNSTEMMSKHFQKHLNHVQRSASYHQNPFLKESEMGFWDHRTRTPNTTPVSTVLNSPEMTDVEGGIGSSLSRSMGQYTKPAHHIRVGRSPVSHAENYSFAEAVSAQATLPTQCSTASGSTSGRSVAVVTDGEVVVFDDIGDTWQNLRITTEAEMSEHKTIQEENDEEEEDDDDEEETVDIFEHGQINQKLRNHHLEAITTTRYVSSGKNVSGIIEYDGSPRRFGHLATSSAINQYYDDNPLTTQPAQTYSLSTKLKPRPGFPQRVMPSPKETTLESPPPSCQELETTTEAPSAIASTSDYTLSEPKLSTFDYLYEFSETRKVLEEFFKCPIAEDDKTLEKLSDFNGSDADSTDIHYEFRGCHNQEDEKDIEHRNSYSLAEGMVTKSPTENVTPTSPVKQNGFGGNQMSENHREINDYDVYLDSASRSSGELGDTEIKHNSTPQRHSRCFRYSPETTDYDSNCGDLDSLSGDFNTTTNYPSFARHYTSMPVLEDGLSSGHASDTENNNPTTISVLMGDNGKKVNEIEAVGMQLRAQSIIDSPIKRSPIMQKLDEFLLNSSNPVRSEPKMPEPIEHPPHNTTNSNIIFKSTDPELESLYSINMVQMTPPPPAPAPHRKASVAGLDSTVPDIQAALKDIRSTLKRTKTFPTQQQQDNHLLSDNAPSPISTSPVWIPSYRCRENIPESTELDALHEKSASGEEEELDTDLETDRLLGHQRVDDQGFYDDNSKWIERKSRFTSSALSKISSPKVPKSNSTSLLRQGLSSLLPSTPEISSTVSSSLKSPNNNLVDLVGGNSNLSIQTGVIQNVSSPEHNDTSIDQKHQDLINESPSGSNASTKDGEKKKKSKNKEVLIEGVLFRARYLGSTQLVCEGQPTKSTRMMQAEEAVSRIKAPDGENQPSTEVDLFISTEKIMVLNTDLKEIMMDHALRTISYIADIGDLVVLMARRRFVPQDVDDGPKPNRTPKMICHVFESDEAQFIAQSIGQAFQVAYMEFLKANGIEDHSFVKEMDYQEVLNSQEIFGDELEIFAKKELQKEVVVPKAKGEILGVVIVESGWGSMLPTVVIANLLSSGAAARCGQLNIGDQIIAINGLSLVGLPLSTCQTYIKNTKTQTVVKFTVVPCPPVVEVKIKRPNTKYQLGFSVQNGVICSLLRGGIAERGGVRVGHRIIEINNQSVVAVPHEKIVNLLATSVGEILMKTMPTSMFRLLTGQENPIYI
ncbi:amyloid-beta A4 precursor protein-binding family A member 1 isoform X1 [Sergentomyia squamirostris]